MELYHLRSFVAVSQTGNLTQAAKRLYTTPPALSAHIKALEDELSTMLFTRSSKGMALTDKGKLLLEKAQATLDSAVDLVNLAATNQSELIGSFNLGLNSSLEQLQLAKLLENLQQNCPGININVSQQSSGKIIDAIINSTLDGGYIYADINQELKSNQLLGIKVTEQHITTIAPKSFTISANSNMAPTIEDLKNQPWITMTNCCPFDSYLTTKLGAELPSIVKSNDDNTRIELVKSGLGLSFIEYQQAQIAEQNQQVQIVPTLDFNTSVYFVVDKTKANEPVTKALLHEIKRLWGLLN